MGLQRHVASHNRAAAGLRFDHQHPTRSTKAVAHVSQPPAFLLRYLEAAPGVAHFEVETVVVLMQTKRGTRLWPGVLGCILERLDAAEVHRGLDLGREAPEAVGVQLSRGGELPARRGERVAKAGTGEQRRVDAVEARRPGGAAARGLPAG